MLGRGSQSGFFTPGSCQTQNISGGAFCDNVLRTRTEVLLCLFLFKYIGDCLRSKSRETTNMMDIRGNRKCSANTIRKVTIPGLSNLSTEVHLVHPVMRECNIGNCFNWVTESNIFFNSYHNSSNFCTQINRPI